MFSFKAAAIFEMPPAERVWNSAPWRSVHRALAQIPKQEADQAREAQRARLQAVRMLLWNQASVDPIRAAEALIKLEAREARLRGLEHADESCGDRSR